MEFAELLRAVFEQGDRVFEYFNSNFDPAKAIPIAFAALSCLWSIYVKWRNSGYRLVDRLEEFIEDQEKRVDTSRAAIASLVEIPSPARPLDQPAFSARSLARQLRKMNWGYGIAASNDLQQATLVTAEQARIAKRQSEEHQKRQALAHLLLGARAAARPAHDILQRNKDRSEALQHFNNALQIDPNDTDALEYAGLMLLELANPISALENFTHLIELRESIGGSSLAKAYRLQATAYEKLAQPELSNANSALTSALKHLPSTEALERARTHEHQGLVRTARGWWTAATQSLEEGRVLYRSLSNTPEGAEGLERTNAAIDRVNRLRNKDEPAEQPTAPNALPSNPGGNWRGLFAKPAKPIG